MRLSWGTASDVGKVRKSNQDQCFADGTVFAVADGMGGANGGEVASQVAMETFVSALSRDDASTKMVSDAVLLANSAVFNQGSADPSLYGMGTTLVSLIYFGSEAQSQAFLLNVGDSRAYVYRNGDLVQLTQDHSWVGEMFRAGMMSADEIATSKGRHVLTRVLGVEKVVDVDMWNFEVLPGDRVLLCSDGLTNELSDDEIGSILGTEDSAQQAADKLVVLAGDAGGYDNITVVVVDFHQSASVATGLNATGDTKTRNVIRVKPVLTPIGFSTSTGTSKSRGPRLQAIPVPLAKGQYRKVGKVGKVLRVGAFLSVLGLIIGVGIFAISSYLRSSYYVAIDSSNHVAIYQGRPGGLLWFTPKLITSESLAVSALPASFVFELRRGVQERDLSSAQTYVRNLKAEIAQFNTSTTSTTTTTTSIPPTSTTLSGGG